MKWRIGLAFVIILAGLLRFWHLTRVPPALNSDEVAIGYNAYSILKTGKDEYNTPHPLLFRSFDDYKMPVYVYMVAGSMKVFGFGDFAVRFPSALLGTLTVIVTYLVTQELFRKKYISLYASLLLAISPWSIYFSRSGYEANAALFFIVLGIYLFFLGLKKGWLLVVSALFFSLAVWTYLTPRIFVPLLTLGIAYVYWKQLWDQKRWVFVSVVVAIVLLWPVIRMSLSPTGQMRAMGVSAFANPSFLEKSAARLERDKSILRVFDNRRISYAITFLRGYFAHFDPNFLFLDKSIEKYRAPDTGLLYLFELPLLGAGIYMLIRYWTKSSAVIFLWIAVAPVAAAFTMQLPHPVRTLVFLPSLQIVSAVGLAALVRKKMLLYMTTVIMFMSIVYFLHQYFQVLPVESASYWYVGRREMTAKINELRNDYDTIYVSNSLDFPYIFYLYYSQVEPALYQAQGGTVSGGFTEQRNHVGNIQFRSISTSLRDPEKKVLFVGLPGEIFKKSLVTDTINFPDGSPAIVFFK